MKRSNKIIAIILLVISIPLAGGYIYMKTRPLPVIGISSPDLTSIKDGSYTGECKTELVRAVVRVDVLNHKITNVSIIKHECGLGKKAEKITNDIEKAQSLEVDTISGATYSSKVILKAVENALQNYKS